MGLRQRTGVEGAAGREGLEGGGALDEAPDVHEGTGETAAPDPRLGTQRQGQTDPGSQPHFVSALSLLVLGKSAESVGNSILHLSRQPAEDGICPPVFLGWS